MLTWLRSAAGGYPKAVGAFVGLFGVVALSFVPLSALLLALPAVVPDETVLTDATGRSSLVGSLLKRLLAVVLAAAALVALVVFPVEAVSYLPAEGVVNLGRHLAGTLPKGAGDLTRTLVYVLVAVYLLDLLLLVAVGKVPLKYNARNLLVRWRITALTALAFTTVVGLLTVMLAFVNGMSALSETSGHPGNVVVLSDGSTDEVFSNLGYNDVSNVERERATLDETDRPLPAPVTVKTAEVNGRPAYLCSRETYFIVSQPIKDVEGKPSGKKRFVQLRGIADPKIAGLVHGVEMLPGGEWFSEAGVDQQGRIQAVLGEGVAGTLGADKGKPRLEVGDEFEMGDRKWVVTGLMKSAGTTFGSEIWARQFYVGPIFRKESYSTLVIRVNDETQASAKALAYQLSQRYKAQKLKAVTEKAYFADLNKTNAQFTVAIAVVAIVMAIGGVFGVMNTMFAAISQRTRDIGVMRILGFKRWQILVSFMLESMGIALAGGLLGCALGSLADGFTATSVLSSGQGGGKTVILRLVVDADILLTGLLLTLMMGRLGGLAPSLSAMRLRILESLR